MEPGLTKQMSSIQGDGPNTNVGQILINLRTDVLIKGNFGDCSSFGILMQMLLYLVPKLESNTMVPTVPIHHAFFQFTIHYVSMNHKDSFKALRDIIHLKYFAHNQQLPHWSDVSNLIAILTTFLFSNWKSKKINMFIGLLSNMQINFHQAIGSTAISVTLSLVRGSCSVLWLIYCTNGIYWHHNCMQGCVRRKHFSWM